MEIKSFEISGLALITPKVFGDDRGFFTERFKKNAFAKLDVPTDFVQDNFSRSAPGVLRGLHYQFQPSQGKLVTCVSGRILDVAVDIRKDSKTFGKSQAVELSGDSPQWFWMPAGFAHGFQVLGDEPADVLYKVDTYYSKDGEGAIAWNDSDLNIGWTKQNVLLSEKDKAAQSFADYAKAPRF